MCEVHKQKNIVNTVHIHLSFFFIEKKEYLKGINGQLYLDNLKKNFLEVEVL